jgi:hypothetical protein
MNSNVKINKQISVTIIKTLIYYQQGRSTSSALL